MGSREEKKTSAVPVSSPEVYQLLGVQPRGGSLAVSAAGHWGTRLPAAPRRLLQLAAS